MYVAGSIAPGLILGMGYRYVLGNPTIDRHRKSRQRRPQSCAYPTLREEKDGGPSRIAFIAHFVSTTGCPPVNQAGFPFSRSHNLALSP